MHKVITLIFFVASYQMASAFNLRNFFRWGQPDTVTNYVHTTNNVTYNFTGNTTCQCCVDNYHLIHHLNNTVEDLKKETRMLLDLINKTSLEFEIQITLLAEQHNATIQNFTQQTVAMQAQQNSTV
jgi:hypothetical protein